MYPLKFQPVFQKRIWGGQRIKSVLAKPVPADFARDGGGVGESWELADLPAGTVQTDSAGAEADGSLSSIITNGPLKGRSLHQAIAQSGRDITGNAPLNAGRFPLLVKFLDAQQDLSVQVHPDAAYCAAHPDAHLKSEAWYVLHAEPGSKIYKGLKPGVTREAFTDALHAGNVAPLLHAIKVKAGDCHYLPSGTVHALGAGILAAEVQTPSDTTFRVFDWNRLGPDGKPRKLHVSEALEVINFSPPERDSASGGSRSHIASLFTTVTRLVTSEFFTLERVRMVQDYQQDIPYSEPVVWIVLEGQGVIQCDAPGAAATTAFTRGDTLLLPAATKNAKVKTITDCAWLEARMPGGVMEPN
jgi:mannose-6-phosphate isomerase